MKHKQTFLDKEKKVNKNTKIMIHDGKLSICIVSNQFANIKSGPGVHAQILAKSFAKKGYDVTVIHPPEKSTVLIEGVSEIIVGSRPSEGHASWITLSRVFAKEIKELLFIKSFDIVHFTDAKYGLFVSKKALGGAKLIGNINDFYLAGAKKNPLFYKKNFIDWKKRWVYYNLMRGLEKRALKKYDALICNSNYTREIIVQNYSLSTDKVYVIHKSSELIGQETIEKSKKIKKILRSSGPIISFVGGNYYRKGLPTIIKSLVILKRDYPKIKLVVVGKDSAEKKIKKLADSLGVFLNVEFLGWRSHDEAMKIVANSDIFAMPSLFEAFGVVYLEAMAQGIPVIAGNIGGQTEIIRDGMDGFLIDPTNNAELVSKIKLILGNSAKRKQIISSAKKRVFEFRPEIMVQKTIKLYECKMLN